MSEENQTQPVEQQSEAAQQQMSPEEAVNMFDVTRQARQAAIASVHKMLGKAAAGHSIDKKEIIKAFANLNSAVSMMDNVIHTILTDTVRLIQSAASVQAVLTKESSVVRTLVLALEEKQILSPGELQTLYKEKVLPKLQEEYMKSQQDASMQQPEAVVPSTPQE